MVLGRQLKSIERERKKDLIRGKSGVGKVQTRTVSDFFTVTRIVGRPELIFNQRPHKDSEKPGRFFQRNGQAHWRLQNKDECHVCDRHRYTVIFFEHGLLARNEDLTEITDPSIIAQLKYDFNQSFLEHRTYTPQIMGTIVAKRKEQGVFDRPLRMLRASMFALLAFAAGKDFCEENDSIKAIQLGVLKFLRFDSIEVLRTMGLTQILEGWPDVLREFVDLNEVVDVLAINKPGLSDYNLEVRDVFVFAGFLPPGYHSFVIYDPRQERAFCKDIVVTPSERRGCYPELPLAAGMEVQKIVPDIWRAWHGDSPKDCHMMLKEASNSVDFNMSNYITDKSDHKACMRILEANFPQFLLF